MKQIINQYTGTTKTINITVKDADGVAVDLTGGTIYLTLKNAIDDAVPVIQKNVTVHTDPTAGVSQIVVDPADTADKDSVTYLFDIMFKDSAGAISSLIFGDWILHESITKRSND